MSDLSTDLSRWLSWALRHEPAAAGITLDEHGWTPIDALLAAAARHGHAMDRDELVEVVTTNDKRRFAISDDGERIRANQGHSVAVDLQLALATPPDVLFHGTPERSVASILANGIERRARHHVHLSADPGTATRVGERRGRAIILRIDAKRMVSDGHRFFRSENGVWLVDAVPAEYVAVAP